MPLPMAYRKVTVCTVDRVDKAKTGRRELLPDAAFLDLFAAGNMP